MLKIKSDLHIHLDATPTKSACIVVLKKAQEENVKVLSFLEHCTYNLYGKNGPLTQLVKSGEIKKYYDGDMITGCELDCYLTGVASQYKEKYEGEIVHILMYGFNPENIFDDEFYKINTRYTLWKDDVNTIINTLKSYDLPTLSFEDFKFEGIHYLKQLYEIITQNNWQEQYILKCNLPKDTFDNGSRFVRTITSKDNGILNFRQKQIPTIQMAIEIAKRNNAKLSIAHPAHMKSNFDEEEYLNAIMSVSQNNSKQNFWGVECLYYMNTEAQENISFDFAKKHNLVATGGTDLQYRLDTLFNMYRILPNGQKMYFDAKPSYLQQRDLDGRMPYIMLDNDTIKELPTMCSQLCKDDCYNPRMEQL